MCIDPYRPGAAVEAKLRRQARAVGLALTRSRRAPSIDNLGGFMIVDLDGNFVVAGARFDLTAVDVADRLASEAGPA